MALRLAIENVTNLPDGGPVSITVSGRRGVDIGRDAHLDWTLPDPNRFISGKHCEIRYEGGAYVLYDVSSNGTFLNGSPHRMHEPRRLQNGDRILIGQYIVAVSVDAAPEAPSEPVVEVARPIRADLWETDEAAPAPIDPRELRPVPERPKTPDFLDWAMDVFDPLGDAPAKSTAAPRFDEDAAWLPPVPKEAAPEPPPPLPSPRRPLWTSEDEGAAPPAPPPAPIPVVPVLAAAPSPAPMPPASAVAPIPSAQQERPIADPADARFVRRFAEAAGLPAEAVARKDADELAAELGGLMKIVAEQLKQLLQARLEAKRVVRSAHQTTIEALDNNPLKYSPTANDALRIMFGPPTRSYLSPTAALEQSFGDLKKHQVDTLAAMQGAVKMLVEDLDPGKIEEAAEPDSGLSALFGSRKAKLWDAYVARYRAKAHRHEDGLIGAFMLYFPQCYDLNRKP